MKDMIYSSQIPAPRCLSNIARKHRRAVYEAIKESGLPLEWRDHPDERMAGTVMAGGFGSVWAPADVYDCSAFWKAYDCLTKTST